jgi:hypothetical protein
MGSQELEDEQSEDDNESRLDRDADSSSVNHSSQSSIQGAEALTHQEERALLQLQDALDCLVRNSSNHDGDSGVGNDSADMDCSAYRTACKECPDILANPSFRIPFLRCCNMDPWAGAKRMVAYWTERQFLFGDVAFRPLTISMLPKLFQEASIVLFPHRDKEGRSVLFFDRLKLNREQLRDDKGRAQCMFYLLDLAVQQNPTVSTDGIVVVALIAQPHKYDTVAKTRDVSWWDSFFQSFSNLYEWKFPKHCVRMATQAIPMQVAMIHMCTLPQATGVGYLRTAAVNVCLNMIGSYYNNITKVHHGSRKPENYAEDEADLTGVDQFARVHQASLLRQLRPFGLYKRQLPDAMGGLFTMHNFELWMQRQSNQEIRNLATEEELLQRKRKVNLVHSRQKRQRRRQENDDLATQCDQLKIENEHAKAETCRIEALLRQANDIVKKVERGHMDASVDWNATSATIYPNVSYSQNIHATSMADPGLSDNRQNIHVGLIQNQPMIDPIPLAVCSNSTLYNDYSLPTAPLQSRLQPHHTSAILGATDMYSSQATQPNLQSHTTTPHLSLSNRSTLAKSSGLHGVQSNHDESIPSAADLCQGFSDDEDDQVFKSQIQGVVDPQPASLWSSMLGLFRPHIYPQGNPNQIYNNSTAVVSTQEPVMSMSSTMNDHYSRHDAHQELHQPSSFATTTAPYSPGWQITTTTTIAHLLPQQQQHLGRDYQYDPWQAALAGKSPPPSAHLNDCTNQSSPSSSAAPPPLTSSQSAVDADWYSW